jgi:hypothetical protein
MKQGIIYIIFLILSITICDAQYFSKHYRNQGAWGRSIVQYDDSSYVIVTAQNSYDTAIAYLKVNDTGKILIYKYYSCKQNTNIYEGWSNDIVKLNNNSIVVASTYQDTAVTKSHLL